MLSPSSGKLPGDPRYGCSGQPEPNVCSLLNPDILPLARYGTAKTCDAAPHPIRETQSHGGSSAVSYIATVHLFGFDAS